MLPKNKGSVAVTQGLFPDRRTLAGVAERPEEVTERAAGSISQNE